MNSAESYTIIQNVNTHKYSIENTDKKFSRGFND